MKDLEIPFVEDRGWKYRLFEILPGFLSWTVLFLPFILAIISPRITVFFIVAYLLMWFAKSLGLLVRNFQGLNTLNRYKELPWTKLLNHLEHGIYDKDVPLPDWHHKNLSRMESSGGANFKPSDVIHAVFIAAYNESNEILEPTFQSVLDSNYDMKKVMVILAYEERGGADIENTALNLVKTYGGHFAYARAIKHPKDIPGEVIGKGGNITHAGREFQKYLEKEKIDPLRVVVTTLDSDNRPHENYFAALSYMYVSCPDPLRSSFQPVPVYTNNIWDAPAPMRVIATGNTFWNVVLSMRPHMIRNFSSHAQSMAALIDTDFWSVRTIVEDGHQFWRTYFRYDGQHDVYPMYIPIYQDAVLANTYRKTLKMQFIQLRRWAYGASDIAYVATKGFFTKNKVPKLDLFLKFMRLVEGHLSWATAPLILAFASFVPILFNPEDIAANQLPFIARRIHTIAMIGIFATLFLSLKLLPPKPLRYKRRRNLWVVLQWVYLPITTIMYNALSALYSQTRLMFGWYMGKFDVTEKAVVTDSKQSDNNS